MKNKERKFLSKYVKIWLFVFLIIFIERLSVSPYDTPGDIYAYLGFIELPFWGFVGFVFCDNLEKADWLLRKIAIIIAWASGLSYLLRLMGLNEQISYLGAASWPARYIFLFGLCWFFTRLFFGRIKFWNVVGLIACSAEIIVAFHKPFIFGLLFVIPTITILVLFFKKVKINFMVRLGFLIFWAALLIMLANYQSKGEMIDYYSDAFYKRYLHLEGAYELEKQDTWETMSRASGGRFELWKQAWPKFFASPWVGSGINPELEIPGGYVSMHNGYLDLLLFIGILGVIPIVIFFIWWFKLVFKSCYSAPFLIIQVANLGYIIGILGINTGGMSRLFYASSAFIFFIMGLALRLSAIQEA